MWIRFAFIAERRATCATETPGTLACKQIDRFSSSDQNRFLLPFFVPKMCLTMSINENGHYHPTALPVRAGIPNAHGTEDLLEIFSRMAIIPHFDGAIARAGKRFLSQFKNNPKSAQSFITETQEGLTIFEPATPIGKSCEYSTFKLSDIKNPNKNVTFHIILPPEKSGINDTFAGLALNSICTTAIEADSFHPQVTIIADEFENLSTAPIPVIERVLKIGRTRGVRLFAFIQDQESLKARYGQLSSMFWTQAAVFMAMDIRNVEEAEEYSKRAGQRAIVTDSATIPKQGGEFDVSVNEEGIPLIRLDELTRMPKFTAILFKEQNPPLMLDLVHYKQIDPWIYRIDDVPGSPAEGHFPIEYRA
ncbi:hypothetical protein TRICHSKD4_0570 [Roseibium sp. TrichSKD4]|nr:hypothetical protein TRICHSKD4_0570 [Roseibium sp. TrichSKD4]